MDLTLAEAQHLARRLVETRGDGQRRSVRLAHFVLGLQSVRPHLPIEVRRADLHDAPASTHPSDPPSGHDGGEPEPA